MAKAMSAAVALAVTIFDIVLVSCSGQGMTEEYLDKQVFAIISFALLLDEANSSMLCNT